MSVLAHAGLIAAAAAATESAIDARQIPESPTAVITYLQDVRPRARNEVTPPTTATPAGGAPSVPVPQAPVITVPAIPTGLTTIPSALPDPAATSFMPNGGPSEAGPILPGPYAGYAGGDAPAAGAYTTVQVERIAVMTGATTPHYPAALRAASIEGEVVVRLVVDTAGRVEPASVIVTRSSHDSFTAAVLDVIPRLRFAPATVGGRRVRQLVELPFTFRLDR